MLQEESKNIPALKEIIDERKGKAVETLSASYAINRLPLEEYERLVEYINKIESERELIVVEKIVAEYEYKEKPSQTEPEDESDYYEQDYQDSYGGNLTVLSSRTFQGPLRSGSTFTSFLGSERIIIRKKDLRKKKTRINIMSILGDSMIFVEPGIRVINRTIPVLGDSKIKFGDHKKLYDYDRELVISGAAILGSVIIKHIKD